MDTDKMTLFSKQSSEFERSRYNKPQYHEVFTVTYASLFPFRVDKACFFQPAILKNAMYGWIDMEISLYETNQREMDKTKNRTLYWC